MLVVFGTRPEAIKLAPFILKAKLDSNFNVKVCSTGQHREMLSAILNFFEIRPDYDLNLMKPGQSLTDISVGTMVGLNKILGEEKFDAVVVQGDTTTSFIASLVAFYNKVKVVHIEAGLRTGDIHSPFPEEFNRKAISLVSNLNFAPTELSKQNLIREYYSEKSIFVTGNTGIDALFEVKKRIFCNENILNDMNSRFSFLNSNKKLILVTVHRRESFGTALEEVMHGLIELSKREDIEILIPLHLNPQVRESAKKVLKNAACWAPEKAPVSEKSISPIWLTEPLDYVPFIFLMDRAHLIITDSGGIQEEAPSLGKPVLVAREKTERPEALDSGNSALIPLQRQAFLKKVCTVLDDQNIYNKMSQAKNPFGDGQACEKILKILATSL